VATGRDKKHEACGSTDAARRNTGFVGHVSNKELKSTNGDIGRTKAQVLRKIAVAFAVSDIPCDELRSMTSPILRGPCLRVEPRYATRRYHRCVPL
jgi:hypothetical protein